MPKTHLIYITIMAEKSGYRSYVLALPPYAAAAACRSLDPNWNGQLTSSPSTLVITILEAHQVRLLFRVSLIGRGLGDTFPLLSHFC